MSQVFRRALLGAIAAAAVGVLTPHSAFADCYDVFGCTDGNAFKLNDLLDGPNCEFLYTMRNGVDRSHGYCFKTAKAIATFGNEGCSIDNANNLGLNSIERGNAALIARAETIKGCPR